MTKTRIIQNIQLKMRINFPLINPNKLFVARIIQVPQEGEMLDFALVIQNRKNKKIT